MEAACLVVRAWEAALSGEPGTEQKCAGGKVPGVPGVPGEASSLGTLPSCIRPALRPTSYLGIHEKGTQNSTTPDTTGRTNGNLPTFCFNNTSNNKIGAIIH